MNHWGDLDESNAAHAICSNLDIAAPIKHLRPDRRLLKLAGSGWRALDFGCGVGRNTKALTSRFAEVLGYDLPNMVRMAREANPDPCVTYTSRWAWVLGHAPYDVTVASLVVQHLEVEEAKARLAEIAQMTVRLVVASRTYMDFGGGDVLAVLEDSFEIEPATYRAADDHFWCAMVPR